MVNLVRVNRNLYVDNRFYEFLRAYDNRVSALILSFDTLDNINYIVVDDSDMVSVLPKSKYKLLDNGVDPCGDGIGRSKMKVGRILSKLFTKDLVSQFIRSESDIEKFVNLYKSHFDSSNKEVKIVEGEEIKKWYLEDNYLMPNGNCFGTLWNSCMRYHNRQKFLNLYVKNDFKLLVMLEKDEHGRDRVRSRALLVEAETTDDSYLPKGTKVKVMDRIYSVYDSDVNTFKTWAKENGYISKFEQTAKSKVFFSVNDEENRFISLVLKLQVPHMNYYPYLDTFSYFKWDKGEFYNNCDIRHDYVLVQANGGLEPERNEEDSDFLEEVENDENW